MKKLSAALILGILFLGCATHKVALEPLPDQSYKYDGEYDPGIFLKWDILEDVKVCVDHVHLWMVNPDETADVDLIEGIFILSGDGEAMLDWYIYFKEDIEYIFALNTDHYYYEQIIPNKKGGLSEKWSLLH